MPRKLRKDKIKSQERIQTSGTQKHQPVYNFSATTPVSHTVPSVLIDPTFAYIKKDLIKTVFLSCLAIATIVYLYVRMQ